jgi:hypothetical protein
MAAWFRPIATPDGHGPRKGALTALDEKKKGRNRVSVGI